MGRRLATNVALRNPDTGIVEVFTPDSDVPEWAEQAIKNPDVWAVEVSTPPDAPDAGEPEAPVAVKPTRRQSVAKWAEYAAASDVEVPEGASKGDIIAALDAAGVPT